MKKILIILLSLMLLLGIVVYGGIQYIHYCDKQEVLNGAEAGNSEYQCILGTWYLTGKYVSQNEPKAVELFQKAAEQGHSKSQAFLGVCYAKGIGIEQNKEEALKWLRKALQNGDPDAGSIIDDIESKSKE